MKKSRLRTTLERAFWPLVGATLFLAALSLIRGELGQYSIASIRGAVGDVPATALALAALLTALDYVALLGYDVLGLRYAGHKLPLRRVALASTTGYAFSQALGFPLLTGAPIRFRLYTAWGVDAADVAKVVAFCTVTFWLGFLAFGGTALLLAPLELPGQTGLSSDLARPLGAIMLVVAAAYVGWCSRVRRPLRFRGEAFDVPSIRVAAQQIGVASLEWLLSASVLWALLPAQLGLGFGETMSLFVLAHLVGLISHVPGGVGVFEAVVLWYLPTSVLEHTVLAALLTYRVIFYLLPLVIGAALLTLAELRVNREAAGDLASAAVRGVSAIAPRVIAALAFVTGTVLILSGALPPGEGDLAWLRSFMPLPIFELSHFTASLVGAALLLLSRGLQRRLDGAYHVTLVLVGLGAVSEVARGPELVTLVPTLVLLAALVSARAEFHRKSSLLAESFTPAWAVAIAVVLLTSIWLGAFAYSRIDYSTELWWTFAFGSDAPRFLRSTVGVSALLGLFGVARLLRPAQPVPDAVDDAVLERLQAIVSEAPHASAHLALMGDKQVLFSESGNSFIMYAVEGDSWIAMGDPVGDPEEFRDLAWRFRELADRAGDSTVFYQVRPEHVPIYVELGLGLIKIGEEASLDLATFSFDGSRAADFRKAIRRLEQAGGTFEIVAPEALPGVLPALEEISDAWLAERDVREKGFSLGAFERGYMLRNPVAVVRLAGTPVAFGNIWRGGRHEVSYDLIRYGPSAPKSTIDFLFARLIMWGQEEGFARMPLGMAPLSGLADDPLAPLASRVGAAVYRYGGHFYNFQGLRAYKEKFDPVWEPRFLASPAGISLPGILTDVTSLIAGGLSGIVRR